MLRCLRQDARQELLAESRKHPAARWLRQIPCIGPIRAALLIALIQTPHRFRTKRQLWAYSGLAWRLEPVRSTASSMGNSGVSKGCWRSVGSTSLNPAMAPQ